jgi:hypothetical protein
LTRAPFVVARVKESTGGYPPSLLALAALAIVGAGMALLMREPRRA